jgi:hypothetical protein
MTCKILAYTKHTVYIDMRILSIKTKIKKYASIGHIGYTHSKQYAFKCIATLRILSLSVHTRKKLVKSLKGKG